MLNKKTQINSSWKMENEENFVAKIQKKLFYVR